MIIQGEHKICEYNKVFSTLTDEIKNEVSFSIYEIYDIDGNEETYQKCETDIKNADFLFIDLHGGLTYFKSYQKLSALFMNKKKFYFYSGIDSEIDEMSKICFLTAFQMNTITAYMRAGGEKNYINLLKYMFKTFGNINCEYEKLEIPKFNGIYGIDESKEKEFLDNIKSETKPIIGILIHFSTYQNGDTKHIDNLIKKIKSENCVPFPIYTYMAPVGENGKGGLKEALNTYYLSDGKSNIDALIITTSFSLSVTSAPGTGGKVVDKSVFEPLNVPLFQAMTTTYSYEKWRKELAGLEPMYLSTNVYQPEFDGQIIGMVIATSEDIMTEYGSKKVYIPIEERTAKMAKLAKNWAILRKIPNKDKKVAIIFHNMPPRIDMIGSAYGLDTPASVFNMVQCLKKMGISMDYDFENGKDIIDKVIAGLTNDGRFLSENEMLKRAAFTAKKEDYEKWFLHYPQKVKDELFRDWGKAPGEFMTVNREILIPGIVNKNIFIGLQPPRAYEEKAEEAYHSTDLVCPYQYLAFYHYLENVYKANIIVHVGTHGTIEWLPGKEIALSNECYPDMAIGTLPHIYPYIIDVPGEGAQAKRRTSAVILDHLIPSMKQSGVYDKLAEIDELITQYYKSLGDDMGKAPILSKKIWENACNINLNQDLNLTDEDFAENNLEVVEKLHVWISEIKTSEIKDGLHIFGEPPTKDDNRMKNMVRLLVRVRNGDVPSIREGICACKGLNLDDLIDFPQKLNSNGKTNSMILDETDSLADDIFTQLDKLNYDKNKIIDLINKTIFPKESSMGEKLKECLGFACEKVYPSLLQTTDELKYFENAINGKFVIPGPSGAPSRGNASILPTGRNFYSIDPSTVPSRAAWEVGKTLANQLIENYKKENGKIPENIAIIVYSGETMKTCGDDIAEILYLYGVKPLYLGNTDRVVGLEVIPLEELGRPRIDVTLRISGLFRDTFPNLIELVDNAVNTVAVLEEPLEQNFVRKNILKDVNEFVKNGMDPDIALKQASVRIFGCPPGTYGAGVDILINSKKWENSDDLGQAYITWSGHAYTKTMHGDKLQDIFSKRLSNCDATVKNISSCEADMLDSDDFYNYHGGLISAVKKVKGSLPSSYSTNAADTGHIITKNIHEETSKIMRSRINNPQWIEGLKKHGFKGAQEFSSMVDIVFGWDATSEVIDDWMYDNIYDTYIGDESLRSWIKKENPYALHAISERLLEASQRGMWNSSEDKVNELQEIYLEMEGSFEGL